MKFNPDIKHRRSIRLKDYDYSSAGIYFITLCTQNNEPFFGHIANGQMNLNPAGQMIEKWFNKLSKKFPDIQIDQWVCMPDHVHFILIKDPFTPSGAHMNSGAHTGAPLHIIIQWFKTMTTNDYINSVTDSQWTPFKVRLWQRNYYEHIIRDNEELEQGRTYIKYNPKNWETENEFKGI
ncbi:MAG: transposase [Candidatus Omnitrophota bacterium]